MYNYRMKTVTDQEILDELFAYCKNKHTEDELLDYLSDVLSKLFAIHECSLFHKPKELKEDVWNFILYKVNKYVENNGISFPERPVVGPKYEKIEDYSKDEKDKGTKNYTPLVNMNKRLTKFLPLFFGIRYASDNGAQYTGWKTKYNPKNTMEEHRKLYDVLFSCCYPNGNSSYKDKVCNNILGNLAKPSIFRFDHKVKGTYSEAFDRIRRELIYSLKSV